MGENNAQLKNYSGNYFSSVLTEIPSGTELVAIKPALFTGWVIVDYNGYHGCVNKHQLIFEKSLAGDPKYDKLKKAEESSFRNDIIMIGVGVLVAFIILICCVKYGRGTIKPTIIKIIKPQIVRKIPLFATLSTSSKFFSPRRRESKELIPTPVPSATENIKF